MLHLTYHYLQHYSSSISRELRRNAASTLPYYASQAQQQMRLRRKACRPARKLEPGGELFDLLAYLLRQRFSPQQIASKVRRMEFPKLEDAYVCRETIYNAIYALPVGEVRKGADHLLAAR
jgi:IS30 family transposase